MYGQVTGPTAEVMGPVGSVAPGTEPTDELEPVDEEEEEPEPAAAEAELPFEAGELAAAFTQLQALAPPGAAWLEFEACEELAGEEGDDDVGGVFEVLEGPTSSWLTAGEVDAGVCPKEVSDPADAVTAGLVGAGAA